VVRGLDTFRDHFKGYEDRLVLPVPCVAARARPVAMHAAIRPTESSLSDDKTAGSRAKRDGHTEGGQRSGNPFPDCLPRTVIRACPASCCEARATLVLGLRGSLVTGGSFSTHARYALSGLQIARSATDP